MMFGILTEKSIKTEDYFNSVKQRAENDLNLIKIFPVFDVLTPIRSKHDCLTIFKIETIFPKFWKLGIIGGVITVFTQSFIIGIISLIFLLSFFLFNSKFYYNVIIRNLRKKFDYKGVLKYYTVEMLVDEGFLKWDRKKS